MRKGIQFHEVEQGSAEWRTLRLGRVTGTTAAELLVNGKGADGLGTGAQSLIYQLAADLITGELPPDFNGYWTERGKELEAQAVRLYEDREFQQVNRPGFISWGAMAGYSPDGAFDDVLIEVKCLSAREHIRFAATGEIPKDHMAQMQWGLFVTGFSRCDYVCFHPDAKGWRLIVTQVLPDPATHDKFKQRLPIIEARVNEIVRAATKGAEKE
jgi:hypothetical protein